MGSWPEDKWTPDSRSLEELRRQLHGRRFDLRASAVAQLYHREALSHDDLEFIIRDMAEHPLPESGFDDRCDDADYRCDSMQWMLDHRPVDLIPLLQHLYRTAVHEGLYRDAAYALEALAALCPEQTLPLIDAWLDSSSSLRRELAVAAARRLPVDLAHPRFQRAGRDPSWGVRSRACICWDFLTEQSLMLEDLSGANPGERREPDLDVFGAGPAIISPDLVRVDFIDELLSAAPDHNALKALVKIVQDDDLIKACACKGLPGHRNEWAQVLVERFGDAGVEALCELARTGTPDDFFHWVDTLITACGLEGQRLRGPAVKHIQALARDLLARNPTPHHVPKGLVAAIGQLDEPEAQEWIWKLLTCGSLRGGGSDLGDLFAHMAPSETLDATLADRFEKALKERDYALATALVGGGIRRGVSRVIQAAQRELDHETTEASSQLHIACVRSLESVGRLELTWLLRALGDPGSETFQVVGFGTHGPLPDEAVKVLEEHLVAPDHDKAAEAAWLLIDRDPLQALNPLIRQVHAQAHPEHSAWITPQLLRAGYDADELLQHIEPAFSSADEVVGESLWGVIDFLNEHRSWGEAWLRRIGSATPHAYLSEGIFARLDPNASGCEFWQSPEAVSH
ncbi:MAG: hypothetical protein HY898_00510 [Deltaproteobacteria bacterium]|nr:hypothetical protein [Deltaproteobacteria bacterium]